MTLGPFFLLTKNDHNSTQKAPKSIIPQEIKSAGHFPSSDSIKSRFKAIFKKRPSWIRRCCFHGFLPPEGDYPRVYSQNEIYDIGTEILLLTKNDHNSTQKAPKSIIPQEVKSAGDSPSCGSVKTGFKAIFKKRPSWIRRMSLLKPSINSLLYTSPSPRD